MQIVNIKSKNRYYYEIINLYYKWWGNIKKKSLTEIDNLYKDKLSNTSLPIIYALIINDTLIGMYELNEKDDIDNEKFTPYLANVFIKECYRHNGYSKILINDAVDKARHLGYNKIYLHSSHRNLYEKYGFNFIKETNTQYGTKRIYEREI